MGLKLLVDVCPLLKPRTGVGNYIFYLLREILRSERVEDVVGICGLRVLNRQALEQLVFATPAPVEAKSKPQGLAKLRHLPKGMFKHLPYGRELRSGLQSLLLRLQWRKYHDYVFWGGNYDIPWVPLPSVLTIHDLSHVHYPEFHPADRVKFLNKHLAKTIQRATVIAVVSEATRQDVLVNLGKQMPLPPITVVYPAAGVDFQTQDAAQAEQVKARYDLPAQFVLSVGTLEPRKNVPRLLEAYASLPETVLAECPLLLVGSQGWLTQELAQKLGTLQYVRWLGYVPDQDMPYLYRAATVFAYVSLFEGFGMPALEAMCCGVPVLTSTSSSLPEVTGQAALRVDPLSVSAIAQGLTDLMQDEGLRKKLSTLSLLQAKQFDWQVSANRLLDLCASLNTTR